MVAWFHGSRTKPRDTTTVYVQPVNPNYYGVVFFTKLPKGSVDIEKTAGSESKHFLTFDEGGFTVKVNSDGSLKFNTGILEDIRTLFNE